MIKRIVRIGQRPVPTLESGLYLSQRRIKIERIGQCPVPTFDNEAKLYRASYPVYNKSKDK